MWYDTHMLGIKFLETAAAALILLALIVGGFAAARKTAREPQNSPHTEDRPRDSDFGLALGDRDQDGLFDWEEALWGTDPDKRDTDGDGVSDGEETKSGRSPLTPGPDEVTAAPILRIPQRAPHGPKKTGTPSTQSAQETGAGNGGAQTRTETIPPAGSSSKEETAGEREVREYGNRLALILLSTVSEESEIAAFKGFLAEDAEPHASARLQAIAADYAKRASLLEAAYVPASAETLHRNLAERTSAQADAVKRIASYRDYTDSTLSTWDTYTERVRASGRALYALALFFKESGVRFSSDEDGAIFALPGS